MPHGKIIFYHVSYTNIIQNGQCGFFKDKNNFEILKIPCGNTSFIVRVTKLVAW
jgi:hypothetical protein